MYKKLRLIALTTTILMAVHGYGNNTDAHSVTSVPALCYDVYGVQTDPSHCDGPRPPAINCAHTHAPLPSSSGGANGMSESNPGVSDAADGSGAGEGSPGGSGEAGGGGPGNGGGER